MKKICKYFSIVAITMMLCGCVKYNVKMNVEKDKSVNLELIYALNESSMNDMSNDMSDMFTDDSITEDTADISLKLAVGETYTINFPVNGYSGSGSAIDIDTDNNIITAVGEGTFVGSLFLEDDEEKTLYVVVGSGEEEQEEVDLSEEINKEEFDYLTKKGFTVDNYTETNDKNEKLVGVKISKKYNSIDEISTNENKKFDFNAVMESEDEFDDSYIFTNNNGVYSSNLVFDFSGEDAEGMESFVSTFDMKYEITLPNKPINSNATSVSEDGKTLTWDLKYGQKNQITLEFKFETNNNLIMYVGIGAGVLILIVIVAVVLTGKNRKNNSASQTTMNNNTISNMQPQNISQDTVAQPSMQSNNVVSPVQTNVVPPQNLDSQVNPSVDATVQTNNFDNGVPPVQNVNPGDNGVQNNQNNQ